MTYLNLQTKQTSVSALWNGASLSLTALGLDSSISYSDQIEVERLFTLSDSIKNQISTYDLHKVFIVEPQYYTVNQTNATITGFSLSGSTTYQFTQGNLAGTTVTIPSVSAGDSIIVRRKTYSTAPYVSWSAGTRLTSSQLNRQVDQLLRLNQELLWKMESEYVRKTDLTGTVSQNTAVIVDSLNMGNFFIYNLAMPATTTFGQNLTSAVTKGFLETKYVNMADSQAQTITGAKTFSSMLTASAGITGTLQTAAQANITSVGTLTSLSVSGASIIGNTLTTGSSGTMKLTASSGASYIQSGLNAASASTAPIIFTAINGNTEWMRVTSAGVGIGTSPAAALHISGASGTASELRLTSTTANTSGKLSLYENAAGAFEVGSTGANNSFYIKDLYNSSTTRLVINNSGKVGVGVDPPTSKLHVHESTASTVVGLQITNAATGFTSTNGLSLQVDNSKAAYVWNYESSPLLFGTANTERMRIDSSGNVGIGNTNPAYKLDVTGNANISGTLSAGTLSASLFGLVGSTIVVSVPNYATALVSGASSGFCSKPANSNVLTLPAGTGLWIGYVMTVTSANAVSTVVSVAGAGGSNMTLSGLTSGSTNTAQVVLMRYQ